VCAELVEYAAKEYYELIVSPFIVREFARTIKKRFSGAMTRVSFAYILRKYVQRAAKDCRSLADKQVSPHVLRHSCAMMIYQTTGDLRKVALWLGHAHMQTTEVYLRADPTDKLNAIEAVVPPSLRRGQFTVPDRLIAALHAT
jgi:integrase/recombinase XerD